MDEVPKLGAVTGEETRGGTEPVETVPVPMFQRYCETGMFRISNNVTAGSVSLREFQNSYHPVRSEGFATFVQLTDGGISKEFILEDCSYSLRLKIERLSSVSFNVDQLKVLQRTKECAGVKGCAPSIYRLSTQH